MLYRRSLPFVLVTVILFLTLWVSRVFSQTENVKGIFGIEKEVAEEVATGRSRLGPAGDPAVRNEPSRPTDIDRDWFGSTLRPNWVYLRSSRIKVEGQGETELGIILRHRMNVVWLGEVNWQSIILKNGGQEIIDVR